MVKKSGEQPHEVFSPVSVCPFPFSPLRGCGRNSDSRGPLPFYLFPDARRQHHLLQYESGHSIRLHKIRRKTFYQMGRFHRSQRSAASGPAAGCRQLHLRLSSELDRTPGLSGRPLWRRFFPLPGRGHGRAGRAHKGRQFHGIPHGEHEILRLLSGGLHHGSGRHGRHL